MLLRVCIYITGCISGVVFTEVGMEGGGVTYINPTATSSTLS